MRLCVLAAEWEHNIIYEALHGGVLHSGVHNKKILLQSASSLVEVPVRAVLGRVNEASHCNLLPKCRYELRCTAKRSVRKQ